MTRSFTRPRRMLVLSLGIALLAAAAPVLAGPGLPESTGEGVASPAQPGVLTAPNLDVAEPDENQPSSGAQVVGPNGMPLATVLSTSFSYYKIIGTGFQPRESTSTYGYTTNGCMYQAAGSVFRFQAPLQLPDGAALKFVRIYYIDTAATDMTVWLTRYEPGQANLDLTSVMSTGSGGFGTALSPEITQIVDTATYAYVLTWGTSVLGSTNQICGVRVAYFAPAPPGGFTPLTPCRIADTRVGQGFTGAYGPPSLAANTPRSFPLFGQCGIPTDATAVSLNITVTNTQGPGDLRVYPQGAVTPPLVSTLNYVGAQTVANAAAVPLGTGGGITVFPDVSGTDLVIDVNGFYH